MEIRERPAATDDADLVVPSIRPPAQPRDVYCYFDNTDKLHAPDNARRLMQLTSVEWSPVRRTAARAKRARAAPAVKRAA